MPLNVIIGYLFSQRLEKMCQGNNPVEMLSEQGKAIALETFEWKKVSLLTAKELKKERVEFVRRHRHLHSKPLELAKLMKKEGLYSDTVENYAVSKQVLRLIEAAKKDMP